MSFYKTLNATVYGLLGLATLALGVLGMLAPTGWLPGIAAEAGTEERHLTQEFGSALVFVGLMTFWCAFNLERSRTVHYLLMAFFALLSLVHWLDYGRDTRPLASALFNTLPFLLLAVVAWINHVHRQRESQLRVGG